jgi:hypothetical protein
MKGIVMKKIIVTAVGSLALLSITFLKTGSAQPEIRNSFGILRPEEINLPTIQNAQMSIEVSAKKKEFVKGELVQVDITILNEGANRTKVFLYDVEEFFDIDVIGPDGLAADKAPPLRYAGSVALIDLNRNPRLTGSVTLNRLFDMSRPGDYKITASKKFRLADANKPSVKIKSSSFSVQVTLEPSRSQWHSIVGYAPNIAPPLRAK